ncbi:Imm45 family immunity protein [Erwinia rhapontici]|uniref:Imm45 family immunity protein n=1 Tax=Erwinia rhapontici TaxID=55212 RepID=UPI001BB44EE5|nr:Imm45 family immunity protein [Erwinia rhapontici]
MRLIDYKKICIARGTVFRLPATWPYEEWVDFMLFETQDDERPYGLIVSSGFKVGLFLVKLPIESISDEGYGLNTEWVINNWSNWIYPECNVEDVHILKEYLATPVD